MGKLFIKAVIFLLFYLLFKSIDPALVMAILVFYIHRVENDLLFKNTKINEAIENIYSRLKFKADIKENRITSIDID